MRSAAGIEPIITATSNYNYDDFPVELCVGNEVFKISSSRLTQHSPVFKEMFSLPQPAGEVRSIVLHNDVGEFKNFLWYIHADPFSANQFLYSEPSIEKCSCLLGIALVAQMYDVRRVEGQALGLVLETFKTLGKGIVSQYLKDLTILSQLLRAAGVTEDEDIRQSCLDVVCANLYFSCYSPRGLKARIIDAVVVARELKNTFVLAHAYYYILQIKDDVWINNPRLDAIDRRRLLCGWRALHAAKESQPRLRLLIRAAPPHTHPHGSWIPNSAIFVAAFGICLTATNGVWTLS